MALQTHEITLDNGLKVIIAETHSSPVVSTWVFYRVGSRNEHGLPGGLSHWIEHMLFKGTERYPKGSIMRLVSQHGGYVNALTGQDFTAYYATIAREHADLVLDYEADRMSGALFDPEEVEAERSVILAELEGGENDPAQLLTEEVSATAFRRHPYRNQTIGTREDLLRITREDLYGYYSRHYAPANAVLVIAGDVDADAASARIGDLFGRIPAGIKAADHVPAEPAQTGERRLQVSLPGAATLLEIGYRAPEASHADFVPLAVAASLLSGGKAIYGYASGQSRSSRLYRALVETELASAVDSEYNPTLDPFLFSLGATVRQGVAPETVEAALHAQISRLCQEPAAPNELGAAIRQTRAQMAYACESVTSQALTLGFAEMVDRSTRIETILDELARVTPEDVMRVSQEYLSERRRTVGWYVPDESGEGDDGSPACPVPHRRRVWGFSGEGCLPIPEGATRARLQNGITVLLQPRDASPAVSLAATLPFGTFLDTDGQEGITNLTASMLRRGTRAHSYQQINDELEGVGASLSIAAGRDELTVSGRCLSEDLDLLIGLLTEILVEPTFPPHELDVLKGQILTHLAELDREPSYRASLAFSEAAYPAGHPYSRSLIGRPDAIRALGSEDLARLYRTRLHPANMILSVVGTLDEDTVLDRLSRALGTWSPQAVESLLTQDDIELSSGLSERRIEIPARPQISLMYGVLSMRRHSEDYYAAVVANVILGELGMMGRLGTSIRDERGLVYDIASDLYTSRSQRPWVVTAGVAPEDLDDTIEAIESELGRMREELVSEEELADTRSLLIGSLPLYLETNDGIASYLLSSEMYGLGLDYIRRYPDLIRAVTREDVRRVMQRYWPEGRAVVTAAGTLACPPEREP